MAIRWEWGELNNIDKMWQCQKDSSYGSNLIRSRFIVGCKDKVKPTRLFNLTDIDRYFRYLLSDRIRIAIDAAQLF